MSDTGASKRTAERAARIAIVALGLVLPTLTLVPFGSIWLWQHGYLIYWAVGVLIAVTAAYLLQRWLFPEAPPKRGEAVSDGDASADSAEESGWSPLEEKAWADVKALASSVDPDKLQSRDAIIRLGGETIETVARRLHAGRADPVWQFTTPEALAIVERVSRRLRLFLVERVPFGDRLTVAQALGLYRWRGTVDFLERAYDIWRLVRLANPVTAVTHEAREHLSKALVQWSRDEIARRLTETYVREVGRAAIDLYGGRLKVSAQALGEYLSPETAADRAAISAVKVEPLRILVAGQTSAGKSSVINALLGGTKAAVDNLPATATFTPYVLEGEGIPAAVLIDSPGLGTDVRSWSALTAKAAECDLVLWVVAANRPDRDIDKRALDSFRHHFSARLDRKQPPILLVVTHIDRVRPFDEWAPPYDLASGTDAKVATIRSAVAAAATDLGFAADHAIPLSVATHQAPYNVEALWSSIAEVMPEALRAHHLRRLNKIKESRGWSSIWSEAGKAGRAIAGSFGRKKTRKEMRS
jgi:predicted GTPase